MPSSAPSSTPPRTTALVQIPSDRGLGPSSPQAQFWSSPQTCHMHASGRKVHEGSRIHGADVHACISFQETARLHVLVTILAPTPLSSKNLLALKCVCVLGRWRAPGVMGRGRGPLGHRTTDAKIRRLERELADKPGGGGPASPPCVAGRGGAVASPTIGCVGGAVAPPEPHGAPRRDRFNKFLPLWLCPCKFRASCCECGRAKAGSGGGAAVAPPSR